MPQSVPYNVMFNGYQGPAEEIPAGDPLVAPPPNLGPFTPWSVHLQLGGARPVHARARIWL